MEQPYSTASASQGVEMTPAQRHEHRKAIARKIIWGVLVVFVITLNLLGVIGMWILLQFFTEDPHVPPYRRPAFRGKVTYDPRVDRPPEVTPMREINRSNDQDIKF